MSRVPPPTLPIEIGLGLQSDKSLADYRVIAECAEDLGFDVVSVFGDLTFQPPAVALMEIARATSRVRLGAACWNPYTMHPYEIAGLAAALDQASDGRAYIGLARGSWLDRLGLTGNRPVSDLRAAAAHVFALLGGDGTGIPDGPFPLAAGTRLSYPVRRPRPPLLLGVWGPRGLAMAGEIADEVKIGGTANPALVPVMRERLDVGAQRVGRRATDIRLVFGAVTVVSHDRDAARERARREVAMYLDVVARLDPTLDLPEVVVRGESIPDDVLDLFAFSGTPGDIVAQAQRLIDAGLDRVEFGTPQGLESTLEGVELLGREVLPALDRTRPA